MRHAALAVFAALAAHAQITIFAGSSTDKYYQGTSCATYPGQSWTCPYSDPLLPAAYPTLRYGAVVAYSIPVAPGSYTGMLVFVEPNKTAPGQRVITASVQDQASFSMDIFALAGGMDKPYSFPFAVTSTGTVSIVIAGQVGNAILSAITLIPVAVTTTGGAPAQTVTVADGTTNRFPLPVGTSVCIVSKNLPQSPGVDYSIQDGAVVFFLAPGPGDVVQLNCW
jgi:hypothetical protein